MMNSGVMGVHRENALAARMAGTMDRNHAVRRPIERKRVPHSQNRMECHIWPQPLFAHCVQERRTRHQHIDASREAALYNGIEGVRIIPPELRVQFGLLRRGLNKR